MTREEQRKWKEAKKALADAEKSIAKNMGFQRSHDYTFCFVGDFAYWVNIYARDDCSALSGNVCVKSNLLDPLFWDLFEVPENRNQPKSFHVYGTFVSQFFLLTKRYEELLESGVEAAYIKILAQVKQDIEQYSMTLKTVADFQKLIKDDPYQKLNFVLCEIYLGHKENANRLIQEAIDNGEHGGFTCGDYTIYDYAKKYLERTE